MAVSAVQEQRDIIVEAIRNITRGNWKVLVVDTISKKLLDNAVAEDDILNQNIANIEVLEDRRQLSPDIEAVYFLTPEPHIVDSVLADLDRGSYRSGYLLWTSLLDPPLRRRLESSPAYRKVVGFDTIPLDFFPRESHLITFRDPWSFPILYHPDCNNIVTVHMRILAQKIMSACVALGELPKVRYYSPKNPTHEASVLSKYLARFVTEELDNYAQFNRNFPPPSSRPPSVLVITDRSMDLMAPFVHEFTYQAMAHDLLTIDEREKVIYRMTINENTSMQEEKDMELGDKDKVWVDNRHRHMKDTIDKLMSDFQKFLDKNPHFAKEGADATNLNVIKDMLAGLPQFQEMKEIYSLHLTMAQECMARFQRDKLPDIASVEQNLATGLDEDNRKPKNVLVEVVRLLDDEAISASDRLRLIILYVLYRDGVVLEDINKLLAHAALPPRDASVLTNLELLGARTIRQNVKDIRPAPPPLFPPNQQNAPVDGEYALSRYEPVLKRLLEDLARGTLDSAVFPYVDPTADTSSDLLAAQGGSLRAGRPNWAAAGRRPAENRQRVLVFMAGGATYSESRACYEVSARQGKDIFLLTSHMLTPSLFIRQVGDLNVDRRKLDIPLDRPKPRVPAHLLERERPPPAPAPAPQVVGAQTAPPRRPSSSVSAPAEPEPPKKGKLEKKRRNFLGMKK
ncbi:related to syntaxin-binding protein sec1-like protein [Cephalotrichum gorgonifer]|uniref:Related to syntaxin-binding protein sec1-like protein n=1 Tax=Cephalotrichum gorgonifer TaxID=2041049 RepID=A0AAE8SSG1_9PEZI|nr:related to syntaxin-binding protein sec1-like protein [Cephalotrichum gorgonifer]